MPQTQRNTQKLNQLKLTSTLGSALGWSDASNVRRPENSAASGIYNLTTSPQTQAEKDNFRQKLLEVRLNDIAQKYCKEKAVSEVSIKVVRVKTTATKDTDGKYTPNWAEEALNDGQLQQTQLFMGGHQIPGLIKVFVFSVDKDRMTENAAAYQEQLNLELNNTPAIEKALRRELWRHTLLDRCRQKGLVIADLAMMDVISIIKIHDAFITSGLLQELIEEREAYLKKHDLNQIDDKFILYKHALRDRIIKPVKSGMSDSEQALMADSVQDLFNARADTEYMEGRIKTVIFCRRSALNQAKNSAKNSSADFETFMKVCSEHEIDGKKINFSFRQSKEDYISQSTIETIKRLDRSLFTPKDEEAIKAYFNYDKSELREMIDDTKSSILKFYQDKEYLK